MTPDEMELAKEGLKESVKQTFAPVQDIMLKVSGPAATEIGLMLGDYFRVWRLKRMARLWADVQRVVLDTGLTLRPVAPRLLFPLLEAATLEDDEGLHMRWVALLTNAARTDFDSDILPCFPDILKQLTSGEAQLLDTAYDDATSNAEQRIDPQAAAFYGYLAPNRISGAVLSAAHPIALENLERLMLVSRHSGVKFSTDDQYSNTFATANHLYVTNLGKAFVRACRVPKREESS
jgi:Abortive infection alpha